MAPPYKAPNFLREDWVSSELIQTLASIIWKNFHPQHPVQGVVPNITVTLVSKPVTLGLQNENKMKIKILGH